MPMEMKQEALTFQGPIAFVDVIFSAPVRNVEAMVSGHGTISAMKVIGQKVRLAAECKGCANGQPFTLFVAANTAKA